MKKASINFDFQTGNMKRTGDGCRLVGNCGLLGLDGWILGFCPIGAFCQEGFFYFVFPSPVEIAGKKGFFSLFD